MENATKALLMAGGVLIAIIIITLLVKTYGNIGAFQRQKLSLEEVEKIEQFNKDYTKYDGQYVYGTEVITVINRATNEKNNGINIDIFVDGILVGNDYITTATEDFRNKPFKCTSIGYDQNTGRVNSIYFVTKEIT